MRNATSTERSLSPSFSNPASHHRQWCKADRATIKVPNSDQALSAFDLLELLSTHPQATYFMRDKGEYMVEAGIRDNDFVAVNRASEAQHGSIVIAIVDNEFTCKKLFQRNGRIRLPAANPTYPNIRPKEDQIIEVWDVVTAAVTLFRA